MKTFILALVLSLAPLTAANAFVSVSPASMEFGGVKVGSSEMQTFFLQNLGTQPVRVNGCFVAGPFQCMLSCFGTLYPGGSCNGNIVFRPQSEHYEFETVSIQMDTDFASISVHGSGIR